MTWAAWLLGLAGPVVVRALTYLGITLLTITGVQEAVQGLISMAQTSYAGMPSAVLGLCYLAGIPTALGIVWGAFNARLALWIAVSSTRWVTGKP